MALVEARRFLAQLDAWAQGLHRRRTLAYYERTGAADVTNRPKAIGTAAETAVVRYLREHGFPHAERRALAGAFDLGDVTGTPGVCWEVKGGQAAKTASDGQVEAWLVETEVERANSRSDVGVLVMARAGIGPVNAGRWWAILPVIVAATPQHATAGGQDWLTVRVQLSQACTLLRAAGYGTGLGAVEATA